MRLEQNLNQGTFGFQIAPMIDVVFVIMLFFMVMAGAVKIENELNSQLPGTLQLRPAPILSMNKLSPFQTREK
jgi:biopolymer transport protein ExbD